MATNNPKVSAYISPHIFDRFKTFYESQNISMSQAVAIIFAEYFQIDEQVNHDSSLISSPLLDRIKAIEEKITSLSDHQSEFTGELLFDVKSLTDRVNRLEETPDLIEDIFKSSKQLSLIENSLQVDSIEATEFSELLSNLPSKLLMKSLDNTLLQPIQSKLLAQRLNTIPNTISANKTKMKPIDFRNWLRDKDPDGIEWKFVEKTSDYSKGYLPADDTPSELLDKLRSWILENQDVKS